MFFLHGTRSKHRGELSTQKYDAWGAMQRQPCFLRRVHPWLMSTSPITRYRACVRARIISHTREIEIFFQCGMTKLYRDNFDAAILSSRVILRVDRKGRFLNYDRNILNRYTF